MRTALALVVEIRLFVTVRDLLEDLGGYGMIILKWILWK
jgi:hypothetical protein